MENRRITVLLIEDNPGDARLIQEMLVEAGDGQFVLEIADQLSLGMERLAEGVVDAVLLDLGLPDSQGFGTFIKVHTQAPEVPIVVLTGLEDKALSTQAVRAGAQDYLTKGQLDKDLVLRAIRYAIERQRLQLKLEEAHQRAQQEREKSEAVRSYQHYLAISQSEGEIPSKGIDHQDELTFTTLVSNYREIVKNYVRAIRIQKSRPSERVRTFAAQLAALQARARDVVRLHLNVLDDISQRVMPTEARTFSSDSRLVLVELLGNLLDIYLDDSSAHNPKPAKGHAT